MEVELVRMKHFMIIFLLNSSFPMRDPEQMPNGHRNSQMIGIPSLQPGVSDTIDTDFFNTIGVTTEPGCSVFQIRRDNQ